MSPRVAISQPQQFIIETSLVFPPTATFSSIHAQQGCFEVKCRLHITSAINIFVRF